MLDYQTNEVRLANTADFVDYVRLCDGLSHIAYLATAFSTHDIAADISDAWRLYLCLTNSRKPIVSGAFTEDGVPRMAKMMQLWIGQRTGWLKASHWDSGGREIVLAINAFRPKPVQPQNPFRALFAKAQHEMLCLQPACWWYFDWKT